MATKKRGQNEGSISRRKNGAYEVRVTYPDGKRRSRYRNTRTQAEKALQEMVEEAAYGIVPPPASQTVAAFLASWLASIKATAKPATYRVHHHSVEHRIVPYIGTRKIRSLTASHVQHLIDALSAEYAPGTIRLTVGTLGRACRQSIVTGALLRNPTHGVSLPAVERREIPELPTTQLLAFMARAKGHRLEAVLTVGIGLGLRSGEMRALRWRDIDFESKRVHIRHTLYWAAHDDWQLVTPKTRSSKVSLPMPAIVVAALKAHRRRQEAERAAAGDAWQDHDFVFTKPNGLPIHSGSFNKWVHRLSREANIDPELCTHDLRHLCATLLHAKGVSLGTIMAVARHSNIQTTVNTYIHVGKQEVAVAVDLMDDLLAAPVLEP